MCVCVCVCATERIKRRRKPFFSSHRKLKTYNKKCTAKQQEMLVISEWKMMLQRCTDKGNEKWNKREKGKKPVEYKWPTKCNAATAIHKWDIFICDMKMRKCTGKRKILPSNWCDVWVSSVSYINCRERQWLRIGTLKSTTKNGNVQTIIIIFIGWHMRIFTMHQVQNIQFESLSSCIKYSFVRSYQLSSTLLAPPTDCYTPGSPYCGGMHSNTNTRFGGCVYQAGRLRFVFVAPDMGE